LITSIALATLILVLLSAAESADAATTVAPNYTLAGIGPAGGAQLTNCRSWSSDADDNGHFYIGCPSGSNPYVYELNEIGQVIRGTALPAEYLYDHVYPMHDVTVTPDGNTLYIAMGPNVDDVGENPGLNLQNGALRGAILRMRRGADGNFTYDPSFRAGPFKIGSGTRYWAARNVDVDASGRLYTSVNEYIFQIDPATGNVATSFGGEQTAYPGGPWTEGLGLPEGLAVAADGNSILVVEQRHQMVQRWTRVGATDWTRDTTFLIGVPDAFSDANCATTDKFQSPYDVATDIAGDIYVVDTSCRRIQRFTKAGAFVQTVWTNGPDGELNHGIGVNWMGSIVAPQLEIVLVRKDPPVKPAPAPAPAPMPAPAPTCTDKASPKITAVTSSKRSTTRALTVTITGTDDCKGIAGIRVSGNIIGTQGWSTGTSQTVRLSGWNGVRTLEIVARDGSGRVSKTTVVRVQLALPQPKLRARTAVRIAGTGCSKIVPGTRIAGSFRVLDRCAKVTGTVHKVQRAGAGYAIQIVLTTTAARALYTNAVGPVQIWIVTDKRTRVTKRVAVRHRLTFIGTIVAESNLSQVHGIPADVVIGS